MFLSIFLTSNNDNTISLPTKQQEQKHIKLFFKMKYVLEFIFLL